jgi:drug/metabolite transporter (DMT)-like permease
VQILICSLLVTAAEIFLKQGAVETALTSHRWSWTGVHALASISVWIGIVLLILSFLSWMYVLKHLALNIAYPLANVVHVLVPIGSWIFLGEAISRLRWYGIALVIVGLIIVAPASSEIEERL